MEYSCDIVMLRYGIIPATENARLLAGMIVLETSPAPNGAVFPWLIDTVYDEFDSGGYIQYLHKAGICSAPGSEPVPD